ncbi:LytR/AlgR family response regulator transcription factor [Sinomicrobium weinanense]|uniref:Response regulator transcription factor n=1 Tax=Sinomicrobium weinanense TaxID=2842200 RepID=A0A926Q424_9FLAO|nr:LytTR family DNA-binding domain-containing protein [Sinomicrobium weinanense]MBC9798172.1 response regulator transcription factor [Sinomicrobium weinanense]MBU3122136.1 LytTR family DNA-binding domain-containing protein [Sinomicrobium weinanense]
MKIIIIEDEKPAARRLQRMIEKLGVSVSFMLHSVEEAVEWFRSNEHPDLIFLDIQLSDGLSFEIFDAVEVKSAVIFTTAYDEYALRAFKLNSIDYLLKPIDDEELQEALEKYRNRIPARSIQLDFEEVKKMLVNPLDRQYKKRFTVKIGQHLKMITTEDIECFYSENKGTYIHTSNGRNYLLDTTLDALEDELSPDTFYRVSRKFFVNVKAIRDIIAYTNARLKLRLHKYSEQEIIVSRERVKGFKDWLG